MPDNDLGFGKAIDISGFKPKPQPTTTHEADDAVADRHGFVSREATTRVAKRKPTSEPLDSIYVRGPLRVINDFKTYCNERELSYAAALEELLNRT